ncbi:hypothetical protein Pla123a_22800 [Posidoniimonas polymericola]|uniref:Uncharacterized protein n=1 Tax=Posidoniimonas polymericola TaxID=2528002 RepID=A0A5C5YQ06_9BACT|nr:hypothetical protein [Posidoniimonas polymericola]TWT76857.1 hypothetical protein Pla123a_22800 [Posidoniimonas polymericola]
MGDSPEPMCFIGECRVCSTGPLGLRKCGGCNQIVVLCDECDSVWPDANLTQPPQPLAGDDLPCPHCGASLLAADASWATRDEVDACGWVAEAIAEQGLELRQGRAFAPRRNVLDLEDEADPGVGE